MMVDFLMFGYNVELEGIGTFSVSLKSRPVMEKNEVRAESIHFKDVKFRSSKEDVYKRQRFLNISNYLFHRIYRF